QLASACQRFAEEHRGLEEDVERLRRDAEGTKQERDNALMKIQMLQQESWQQKQLWEEERQRLVGKWRQEKKERERIADTLAKSKQDDSKTQVEEGGNRGVPDGHRLRPVREGIRASMDVSLPP